MFGFLTQRPQSVVCASGLNSDSIPPHGRSTSAPGVDAPAMLLTALKPRARRNSVTRRLRAPEWQRISSACSRNASSCSESDAWNMLGPGDAADLELVGSRTFDDDGVVRSLVAKLLRLGDRELEGYRFRPWSFVGHRRRRIVAGLGAQRGEGAPFTAERTTAVARAA